MARTTIPQKQKPVAAMRRRTRRAHRRETERVERRRAHFRLPEFTDKQIKARMAESRREQASISLDRHKTLESYLDKDAAIDLRETVLERGYDYQCQLLDISSWRAARDYDPFWEELIPQRIVVSEEEYEWLEQQLREEPFHDSVCWDPDTLPCGCHITCDYDDFDDLFDTYLGESHQERQTLDEEHMR